MRIAVPLAIVLLLTSPALAATPEEIEAQARKLEQQFMAPCCGANILAMHDSGSAQAMKREIREMLAAGKTRTEIVDH